MRKLLIAGLTSLIVAGSATVAPAAVINWNTWNTVSSGSALAGSIVTTYQGPAEALVLNYPSYLPAATYADGVTVNNAPDASNNILRITGGDASIQTLTFSQAVVNPVFAIWSLGQPGIDASFNFIGATPTFVAGGTSNEYQGSAINVDGNSS